MVETKNLVIHPITSPLNPNRTGFSGLKSGPGGGGGKIVHRAHLLTFTDEFMAGAANSNQIHQEKHFF